jgi:hypothetical protein
MGAHAQLTRLLIIPSDQRRTNGAGTCCYSSAVLAVAELPYRMPSRLLEVGQLEYRSLRASAGVKLKSIPIFWKRLLQTYFLIANQL